MKKHKKQKKRYFFSVVEEAILNPDYEDYCAGRVEVYDRYSKSPYAIYEARFLIPKEFMEDFRKTFDFKESNLPVIIKWEMKY